MTELKKSILILLSLAIFVPYGYSEEPPGAPPVSRSGAVKIKVAQPQEKEDGMEKIKFSYDSTGKKDPFQPYKSYVPIDDQIGRPGDDDVVEVPLTELEKYELSQFKLVAVMNFTGKGVAMMEDPEGKGHTIYLGTLIGKNKGKVVEIVSGKVVVEEKYWDIMGEMETKRRDLVIEAPEGGR